MATQLELTEKSTKLLEEIRKLSKQANKLTGATTGKGLTQFKFFGDKVQKFNEYRDSTAKVFNFLTRKAKRDEKALAAMKNMTVEQLRAETKAKQQFEILKEKFSKQLELDAMSNGQLGEYFNNLNKDQQKLINGSETHQKELLKFFGETQLESDLSEDERNKKLVTEIERLANINEEQLKKQIETAADNRRKESLQIQGGKENERFLASKVEPKSPITGQESDGSGIKDEVIGSSIGAIIGKFLSPGGGIFKAIGKGLMFIPLGITKLLAFAFNPIGLALIGGLLLFTFKDKISEFLGKAFNFLGEKLASFTKMIGDFFAAPIKLYFKGLKFIGGKILSVFKSIGGFIGKILDKVRDYLSDIPIIGRFFKKKGGDGKAPDIDVEDKGKAPDIDVEDKKDESVKLDSDNNKKRVFTDTFGVSGEIQERVFTAGEIQASTMTQSTPTNLDEKLKIVKDIENNAIDKVGNANQPVVANLVNNAQNVSNNTTENVIKSVRNNDPMIQAFRNYR